MIDNLSMVVQAFTRRILTSLSVDETWLTRYVSLSTKFRGLSLRMDMVPSRLRRICSRGFGWVRCIYKKF